MPLAGQAATVSDIWNPNNAQIETTKIEIDHFKKGKWGGGWWRKNDSRPCGDCEVNGNCGC